MPGAGRERGTLTTSRRIDARLDNPPGALAVRLAGAGSRRIRALQVRDIVAERKLRKGAAARPQPPHFFCRRLVLHDRLISATTC